ncbi:MAG: hypothetical protein WD988_01575 [Candidatus Curtissbacteria bacterium]
MRSKVENSKVDPKVKEILVMLGAGTFLAASLIMPGLPVVTKIILDLKEESQRNKDKRVWAKYNTWRLKQVIKRLHQQKLVEIGQEEGILVIKITEAGKNKLLKYNLENIKLDNSSWDGKWRLIIYDVKTQKKKNSEMFRRMLNRLRILKLQKSVYLTPYKCKDEIEYLRQVYDIGEETMILTVGELENEQAYRTYFGL